MVVGSETFRGTVSGIMAMIACHKMIGKEMTNLELSDKMDEYLDLIMYPGSREAVKLAVYKEL